MCSLAGLNVRKVPSEEEVILSCDDSQFLQFIACGSPREFAVSFEIRINGKDGVEHTITPPNNSPLGYGRDAEAYGITSTTLMRQPLDMFEMCKDILVRVWCHHRYITMYSPIRIEFVHTRTRTRPPSQSITSGGNFSLRFQEPPPTTVASPPTIVSTAFPTTFSITTFNIGTTQSQIGQIGSSFKATIALCCVLVTILGTIVATLVIVLIYNKYRSKCRSGQEDLESSYEATSPSKSEDPAEVNQESEHSLHSADTDVNISTAPLSNSSEN